MRISVRKLARTSVRTLGIAAWILTALHGAASATSPAPDVYTVFFESGRATISAQGQQTILSFIRACEMRGSADQIVIMAHTDGAEASEALAKSRGESVRDSLAALGVPAESVLVFAYGDASPLVRTSPNTREPQNRRVELVLPGAMRWQGGKSLVARDVRHPCGK